MSDPASLVSHHKVGWGDLLTGRNAVRSLALAGGVGLHAINVYIATTILPSVVTDIGGLDYYAWNTTLFIVASIIGSTLAVKLLRAVGPRKAYAISAGVFALGTLICAMSPSMPMLLVGRFVQGFGGGFMLALSYAMIRIAFPEALWPRAMALVSGMWGVATLIGPAVGGIFAELGQWRAAFWLVVPAALLFAVIALFVLPDERHEDEDTNRLPFAQLTLLTLAVFAVSLGSVSPQVIWNVAGISSAIILIAFMIRLETTSSKRLLPSGSFSFSQPLGPVIVTMSLLALTVTSVEVFIPLFLQVLHHQTPLVAGYLAALMGAGWTLGSIMSSGIASRRVRDVIIIGPLTSFAGMVLLLWLLPIASGGTYLELLPLCAGFLAVGCGVGMTWPHLLTRVLKVAPDDEKDLASTAITTVQLFSAGLGAAMAGMVTSLGGLTVPGGMAGTSSAAFWLFLSFGLGPLLAFFCASRMVKRW
ncbi:MFS transporter [Pseudochrobactrum sp. sp1633]|uniref:MFS transporter n=1 Tax=Pseudochrobactrum sp. sp1633 TaxID=3036706 RepID=UPI0025A66BA3|nr:MFS transporter [Pseudochrobactrum sp. sp1633]MDM8344693.1 MFS transporter [Pseudochrobactrum sp. sp1633]HWD13547.1 MFS transporter [Pseudochrobactrum sp.]